MFTGFSGRTDSRTDSLTYRQTRSTVLFFNDGGGIQSDKVQMNLRGWKQQCCRLWRDVEKVLVEWTRSTSSESGSEETKTGLVLAESRSNEVHIWVTRSGQVNVEVE